MTYDIFICCREIDEFGDRTLDSMNAEEIYEELRTSGYNVFWDRNPLSDSLDATSMQAIESSGVFLLFVTDEEYISGGKTNREYKEYLEEKRKDPDKTIIICYQNFDCGDLPRELRGMQELDLKKTGSKQELMYGIEKILSHNTEKNEAEPEDVFAVTAESQLSRAKILLKDKKWEKADECYELVLNSDPRNAEAYFGKIFCKYREGTKEELIQNMTSISPNESEKRNILDGHRRDFQQEMHTFNVANYFSMPDMEDIASMEGDYFIEKPAIDKRCKIVEELLKNDTDLAHALEFSDGELRQEIQDFCEKLKRSMEDKLREIEESDENSRKEKWNFVKTQIERQYDEAVKKREQDYEDVCDLHSEGDLKASVQTFERLADYKDGIERKEKALELLAVRQMLGDGKKYFLERMTEEKPDVLAAYLNLIQEREFRDDTLLEKLARRAYLVLEAIFLFYFEVWFFWQGYLIIFLSAMMNFFFRTRLIGKKGKIHIPFVLLYMLSAIAIIIIHVTNYNFQMIQFYITSALLALAVIGRMINVSKDMRVYKEICRIVSTAKEFEEEKKSSINELWKSVLGRSCPVSAVPVSEILMEQAKPYSMEQWFIDCMRENGIVEIT